MLKFLSPEKRCRDLNTVSNVQIEPVAGVWLYWPNPTPLREWLTDSLLWPLLRFPFPHYYTLKWYPATVCLREQRLPMVQKCYCHYYHHIVDIINTIIITLIVNVLKMLNFCWWVVAHYWWVVAHCKISTLSDPPFSFSMITPSNMPKNLKFLSRVNFW